MDFARWITDYIASYLEDVADVADNFDHDEAIMLGFAGASVIKNIAERFQQLSPEDREGAIKVLKAAQFSTPTVLGLVDEFADFTQQFIPSLPICQAGVDLIKEFEGCKLDAYQCPTGVWTIGYGHTGQEVQPGVSIPQAEADRLLLEDIKEAAQAVDHLVTVELNQNQRAALTSFVFNLGAGGLKKSTLLRRLNIGDYSCVPSEMSRWVFGGTKRLAGLVRRRAAEGELFMREV